MRSLTAAERLAISDSAGHWCFAYLEVTADDGATWLNLGALSVSQATRDFFNRATLSDSIDTNTLSFSATLKREVDTDSLSPFRTDSLVNESVVTPSTYAPALDLQRQWRIMVAVRARGVVPALPTGYREMASGYIRRLVVNGTGDTIDVEGVGREAPILDAFVVTDRTYSGDMEDVIQDALDDQLGIGVVTLSTPASPNFIVDDTIGDINLMPALSDIAALTGWSLRYRYDASDTLSLTLFEPQRSAAVADWEIDSEEYEDITGEIDISGVRNYIKVRCQINGVTTEVISPGAESGTVACSGGVATFSLSQAGVIADGALIVVDDVGYRVTNFDGTTSCTLVAAPDFAASAFYTSSSLTRYGLQTFVIDLSAGTQITDLTAASNLADAVRADREDPALVQSITAPGLWFVDLHDYVGTLANGTHYNEDQAGGVTSYSHTFENGMLVSTVNLAGSPKGRYTTWKRIGSGAPASTLLPKITLLTATSQEVLVGSSRVAGVFATATVDSATLSVQFELSATLDFAVVIATNSVDVTNGTAEYGWVGSGYVTPSVAYYVRATPYSGALSGTTPTGIAGDWVIASTFTRLTPTQAEFDTIADSITNIGDSLGTLSGKETFFTVPENDTWLDLSTIPTPEVEVGDEFRRQRFLVGAGSVRLNANIKDITGSPSIRLKYTTNSFASVSDVLSWMPSGLGLQSSSWSALPVGAIADVGLTWYVGDGANTATLKLYQLDAEFRPTNVVVEEATVSARGVASVVATLDVISGSSGATPWDDDFNVGASVDTAGTRFAGANAWTAFNHGASGCSFTQSGSILTASSGAADPGTNPRGYYQTLPAGDYRFRIKITPAGFSGNYQAGGLLLRESSTGKLLLPCIASDGAFKEQVRRLTSTTGWYANYNGGIASSTNPHWIEVERSGSTLTFRGTETAADGDDLTTTLASSWATSTQTDDFTVGPDQIGFFVNSASLLGWTAYIDWFLRLA